MARLRQPEFDPDVAAQFVAGDLPVIETPLINIRDLDHEPGPKTGMNPMDEAMFAREDEKAQLAIAEFERQLKNLPPD